MNDLATMNDLASTPTPTSAVRAERAARFGPALQLVLMIVAIALVFYLATVFVFSWTVLPANDFGRTYGAAEQFLDGDDMYEWTLGTGARLEKDYAIDLYDMNPPHLHLLFLPFVLIGNVDLAFVLWWVVSGLCLYQSLKWLRAELNLRLTPTQRQTVLVFLLGYSGTVAMAFTAQLAFVMLVPITLMWLAARRGRWVRVGVLLGLVLSIKPFLGVLLAYLGWRRRWRAAFACVAVTVLCYAVGICVFGWENHLSWYRRMAISKDWAWLHINASIMGILSRTFTESVWYVPFTLLSQGVIWSLWIIVGGALGLLTLAATGRGESAEGVDQDFALLLASCVFFCPLGWIYYLWLALPPFAALLQRGWLAQVWGRRRWLLLLLMLVACFWPPMKTQLGQPDRIGPRRPKFMPPIGKGWPFPPQAIFTITIGSVYFWGLLTLWGGLMASGFARKRRERAEALELEPLDPADFRVSVVMPVYSETDTVRSLAEGLIGELGSRLCEIIVVQSPRASERSRAICRQLSEDHPQVRLHVQRNNPGLGRAVREGFERVRGNLVLMMDSDGEMELDTVPRLLAEMERGGHALVVASRWLPGGGFHGYDRKKYYLNWCFQQLFRWLYWTPLHDLTYGYKLIRAELVRGIAWQGTLHEIACETTLKPVRLGAPAAEVPSTWTARTQGVSTNPFWRNWRYLRMAASILVRGVDFGADLPPDRVRTMVEADDGRSPILKPILVKES